MKKTVFDVEVRTLECSQCGAPMITGRGGGTVQCDYCKAQSQIAVRARHVVERRGSMADEVARRARLKAQLDAPLTGHAYDLTRTPLGMSSVSGLPALRKQWQRAKPQVDASDAEAQRALCWLAFRLADALDREGQPLAERAVLETALDLLPDEGHRHLLRCRLAMEAIAEGDLDSAEGWLGECDPEPEVLELDSPYREAKARVCLRRQDFRGVLAVVGQKRGDVPIHSAHEAACDRLRAHSLESLGERDLADAELNQSLGKQRANRIAAMHKEQMALGPLLRTRTAELAKVSGGFPAALASGLFVWPIAAALLLLVVTIPRCADMDPLLGVNGYALCPNVCESCDGPLRVVTRWSCSGNSCSTNGPQYFCPSPENRIEQMNDVMLKQSMYKLSDFELSIAPAATSYLILLVFASPLLLLRTMRRYRRDEGKRKALEREVEGLARAARLPVPTVQRSPTGLAVALCFAGAAIAIPVLVTILELFA